MHWTAHAAEWLALALAFGAVLYARHFGGGAALEQLERANRILVHRVDELEDENKRQAVELAKLRNETNVATAIGPVLTALHTHEELAERRSTATLAVLDLIAARLGPEREAI